MVPINLDLRIKRDMFGIALDIMLKNVDKTPERCARNISEILCTSVLDKNSKRNIKKVYNDVLSLCMKEDKKVVREEVLERYFVSEEV